MKLYIETETEGVYGLVDTFLNETISLNTKTTYTQDITAVYKGFTNNFSVDASPNNIKLMGYFGYTEQAAPTNIKKRAKLELGGLIYKEGIITLENTSWINSKPSLFELSFSDGQKNLSETLGTDLLSDLSDDDGNLYWTTKNIQNGLQGIQTASGGVRWFIPLVSTERIFILSNSPEALTTDNINYNASKPITSENVLLPQEIRPAIFYNDILTAINKKYDVKIDPTPFIGSITQLTDLATMCLAADVAIPEVKAKINNWWGYDNFREERFDITPKPDINAFELSYIGYGDGGIHDASFGFNIYLTQIPYLFGVFDPGSIIYANKNYINSLEIWEVNSDGSKKKKLSYEIKSGGEKKSANLSVNIGLDVFYPEGGNSPSTLVKPLISVFVAADKLADWKYTILDFNWAYETWSKGMFNIVQGNTAATTVNLFKSLPEMKVIDFVKSIYTMFGFKKFGTDILSEFNYAQKTVDGTAHKAFRNENDLTPYADLSKFTKKTNAYYDSYNLKHFTSTYQQNVAFALANEMEWGQMKYPTTGNPTSQFLIETKFTSPVLNPVATDNDTVINTFYPFGDEPKLNDIETRYVYESNTKEFPVFYYNGVVDLLTTYGFVDTDLKILKSISKYHKVGHKSTRIFTGTDNYITCLFNIVTNDYIDQNTLYVQGYKNYIEDTLSGKKLIHTINLNLPNTEIQKFSDNDEIIIKETKYNILESTIGLNDGKTKLLLLNK